MMTREELNAKIAELETALQERDDKIAALEQTAGKEADELRVQLSTREEMIQAAEQQLAEANQAIADLTKENVDMAAQIGELTQERDKAQAALANPATVDAATLATMTVTGGISDAEADELDRKAQDEDPEPTTMRERYEAMPAGQERTAFWHAHKREILDSE